MPIAPMPASGPVAIPTGGTGPRPQGKLVAQNQEQEAARGKFAAKLLVALLFVAVAMGGFFAYNLWFADNAASAPVVAKPSAAPETAATPAATAETAPSAAQVPPARGPLATDTPQSAAGQIIAKAQNAVAAHDAAFTQPTNEVLATASQPAGTSAEGSSATVAAPVDVQPAAVPEPVAPPPRPEPGANFKAFVVNLKINGVFQGENARAMLNGKMYRLGEVVDSKLGIVFLRLEPEDKRIVFEDSRGAIMSRRY